MPAYRDKKRGTWYASFYYTDWQGHRKLKKKRGDWGVIVNSCFFLGIVAAFTPLIFASGTVYALTFLVSMGVAALCVLCMRRFQMNWMGSFIMSISLIVSMAASVFLERLLK